jgi:hypothetical protein
VSIYCCFSPFLLFLFFVLSCPSVYQDVVYFVFSYIFSLVSNTSINLCDIKLIWYSCMSICSALPRLSIHLLLLSTLQEIYKILYLSGFCSFNILSVYILLFFSCSGSFSFCSFLFFCISICSISSFLLIYFLLYLTQLLTCAILNLCLYVLRYHFFLFISQLSTVAMFKYLPFNYISLIYSQHYTKYTPISFWFLELKYFECLYTTVFLLFWCFFILFFLVCLFVSYIFPLVSNTSIDLCDIKLI